MTDTNDLQMLDATGSDDQNEEVKEPNVGRNPRKLIRQC